MLRTPQITNIRASAEKIAKECGVDNFQLTPEDIRLLLICRAMPYGKLTITLHEGKPTSVQRIEENISLTKEIFFKDCVQ